MYGNVNITHLPLSASSSSSSCCRNNSDWNHHGNRISTWKQGCGEAGGGGMERQREREWKRGLGPLITQHDLWRSGKEHLQRVHSSHWEKRIWGIKGQAAIQQVDSFSLFAPFCLWLSASLSPNFSFFSHCNIKCFFLSVALLFMCWGQTGPSDDRHIMHMFIQSELNPFLS